MFVSTTTKCIIPTVGFLFCFFPLFFINCRNYPGVSFCNSQYTTNCTTNNIANISVVTLERIHYDWMSDSAWFTYIFQLIQMKKHNIQNIWLKGIWYVQAQCSLYYPLCVSEFLWTHGFLWAHRVRCGYIMIFMENGKLGKI